MVWLLALFVIAATLLLSHTTFGRRLYAIGNSVKVAEFAGVSAGTVLTWAYVLSAICAALVGLMLSGHTHGGQVVVPFYGAPRVPSRYGQKYLQGLVRGPSCDIFVSRGVGTVTPPVRLFCRPEVVLLTLTGRGVA